MAITLSGVLKDPYGVPIPNAIIRFDAVRTSNTVVKTLRAEEKTSTNGSYSISVEEGRYNISVKQGQSLMVVAKNLEVRSDSTAADLNDLLIEWQGEDDVTPAIILEFRALTDEARGYRDEAGASADAAAASATAANTAKNQAQTARNQAQTAAGNAADSEDAAAASATAANTSKNQAATSATNAAGSATAASTSASNAASSASAAGTSETNAANSASAASTSEQNTSASESNAAQSASDAAASAASVDASEIVHAPGSGLPNEAGTAALRDVGTAATQIPTTGHVDDRCLNNWNNLSEVASKSGARTNLGLTDTATRQPSGSGNVVTEDSYGLGSVIPPNRLDLHYPSWTGFSRYDLSTSGTPSNYGMAMHIFYRDGAADRRVVLAFPTTGGAYLSTRTSGTQHIYNKQLWIDGFNTTVDGNGFIKQASPIVRLGNDDSMVTEGDGWESAGSGATNMHAPGVTAEHVGVGVYQVSGSDGFAADGWSVEIPQDINGNNLVFVETEIDSESVITVRTYTRQFDVSTAMVVAGDPMDIPDGRWIDLRLKMPEAEEQVADQSDRTAT